MNILVLGLGNTLLGDDGAGVYALRKLAQTSPATDHDIDFVDGGTLSFTLSGLIQEADHLIVLDAAKLNQSPGSVQVFEGQAMDSFVNSGKCSSVHEVSLAELMDIARLTEHLPSRRALVGIQPQCLDWADQPTPEVMQGIDLACDQVRSLLEVWRR